jgi:hypothetical protein
MARWETPRSSAASIGAFEGLPSSILRAPASLSPSCGSDRAGLWSPAWIFQCSRVSNSTARGASETHAVSNPHGFLLTLRFNTSDSDSERSVRHKPCSDQQHGARRKRRRRRRTALDYQSWTPLRSWSSRVEDRSWRFERKRVAA